MMIDSTSVAVALDWLATGVTIPVDVAVPLPVAAGVMRAVSVPDVAVRLGTGVNERVSVGTAVGEGTIMKSVRHAAILEAIRDRVIETQAELTDYLRERGMVVTQATVSRDIKNLRLIKVPAGEGRYRYAVPQDFNPGNLVRRARRMFSEFVTNVDFSENLIVIKTTPGSAQGVAAALDGLAWPEVLGTVAGDDSILVIVRVRTESTGGAESRAASASKEVLAKLMDLRR
jgi:transcriptional regulator of arginine metabolism